MQSRPEVIIDSHIHCYPSEVMADPVAWARNRGEKHWEELHAPAQSGASLHGWVDRETVLRDMDRGGIDKAVLLSWYWEHQATCEDQNRWYAQWIREVPERFMAFAAVQPRAGERAFDEVRRALDNGFCGIGEILPAAQGFANDDPTWLRILAWAQEVGVPVTLHVTEPVGHQYKGRVETRLADYQVLAERFPDLKMILAHWGGGLAFFELNPMFRRVARNICYDTAASPLLYDLRIFRSVADIVGAEKIVFGSDYPLRLFPSLGEGPEFGRMVASVESSGLSESELELVFSGNIARILDRG